MKKLLVLLFLITSVVVQAQPLSGTYKIGTPLASGCGGACDFASITLAGGAFAAINSRGINGNVIFEIYTNITTETGANVLGPITDTGGPHTVTFRSNTATMRTISGTNNSQGLIALAGADRVIFDGRAPGDATMSYTNRYLTIRNASTTTATFGISSDAVSCSIRSVIIESANASASGVVNIAGGSIAGNDDLTIDYCDIKDAATLPQVGIRLDGGASQTNDNIQLTNNRIFNFFSASAGGTGISVGNFNSNMVIAGNSIYQTANRTATANITYRGIHINSPAGNNFIISNNAIGGNAEGATGVQRVINAPAGGFIRARLIEIEEVGFVLPTVISGNIIRGFQTTNLTSTTAASASLYGMLLVRGKLEVRNNTIGGTTTDQRITGTFTNCTGRVAGIALQTNSAVTSIDGLVENNNIDGLFVTSSGSVSGDRLQSVGIFIAQQAGQLTMRRNVIGNLTGNEYFTTSTTTVNAGTYVAGIYASTSVNLTIERNKIAHIWNRVNNSGNPQFFGIHLNTPTDVQLTSNEIYNLTSLTTSSDYDAVAGIFLYEAGTGNVQIAKNTMWGIAAANGATINGVLLRTTAPAPFVPRVENNMITLGMGASQNLEFRGIYLRGVSGNTTQGTVHIYANSVAVIGTSTGSLPTHAFYRSSTHDAPVELRTNIFLNTRTGGTGSHYALTGQDGFANFTSNYNLLFTTTAGNLTNFNGTARNFATWQTASSQDANSRNFNISPKFMAINSGNLRIPDDGSADVLNNVVDLGAASAATNPVSNDIDNANRTGICDIGASEVMVTWLGTTDTNWVTTTNWSGGVVPSCGGRELIKIGPNIPGIVLNQPTITGTTTANFRELIVLEGATVTLSGSGQLVQCTTGVSPYALVNEGTLTVTGGQSITLYGDFQQNNVFNTGTGAVSLIAASSQSINGDISPVSFHNLTVAGGGSKLISQSVVVNGVLNLTSGLVMSSLSFPLTLSTTGSYLGGSNASYISGPLGKQTNSTSPFTYPVGKGGKIRPATIEPSNSLASTFFVEYFNESAIDNIGSAMDVTITTVSDIEYWRINRTGSASGFVTLIWDFASGVSNDPLDRDLLSVVRQSMDQPLSK
ncbi:MAG: hypothetical protein KF763_06310 [Cyclobacteriaceae bacterium]|nr:hypothetical protein [Cyclobacteriaceae bacterium]